MKKNLIFFLGTKAQFIKTIPIINEVDNNSYEVFLYDTCQHKSITQREIKKIKVDFKRIETSKNQFPAESIFELVLWFIKSFLLLFTKKLRFKDRKNSICFIHGNTLSTVLGIVWARKNNLKTIHIEGGYRSFNWLKPFPEEIIRYFSSKFSNYVVCFDDESFANLSDMGINGEIIQVARNTIYDQKYLISPPTIHESKLTISIHRNENIYNKKRLSETVNFLINIKRNYFEIANWYMHPQTKKNLEKYNHIEKLNQAGIVTKELIEHEQFIKEIKTSKCVVTDGESVLEESKIIGTPTYALLNRLENKESEGKNILISKYNHHQNISFFENIEEYITVVDREDNSSPSKEIIDFINGVF